MELGRTYVTQMLSCEPGDATKQPMDSASLKATGISSIWHPLCLWTAGMRDTETKARAPCDTGSMQHLHSALSQFTSTSYIQI